MSQISVVVPTYQRCSTLFSALDSLERQTLHRSRYEVIAVDDGSTDSTEDACRQWADGTQRRYVRQNHGGAGAARNLGLFMSRFPIVHFFDDDEIADERMLEQHLLAHERYAGENVAVLGHTDWAPQLEVTPLMHYIVAVGQFLLSYPSIPRDQPLGFSHFWTGRLSVKRDFLTAHGIFSTSMRRLEDIELGYRLQRHGLEVRYSPSAKSFRLTTFSFSSFCEHLDRDGEWVYELCRRHSAPEMERYCGVAEALRQWDEVRDQVEGWKAEAKSLEERLGSAFATLESDDLVPLWDLYRRCFVASRARGIARGCRSPNGSGPAAEVGQFR